VDTTLTGSRKVHSAPAARFRLFFRGCIFVGILIACSAHAWPVFGQTDDVAQQIARLQGSDPKLRLWAADALAKSGDRRAVEPLIGALHDPDPQMRSLAAMGLGRIGDPRAVTPLIAALGDSNEDGSMAAGMALGQLRDARAIAPLIATLHHGERFTVVLAQLGAAAYEPLIAALHDSDPEMRKNAALALAEMRDPRSADALIAAFHDPVPKVREAAAWALTANSDPRVPDLLVQALRDPDMEVRTAVAGQLGWKKDPRFVEPLIANLKETNDALRIQACIALGRLQDPRAVGPLVETAKSKNSDLASQAVRALGEIGSPAAVDALIVIANPLVSPEKAGLSHAPTPGDTNGTWDLSQAAIDALGETGDSRAIAYLAAALQNPNAGVRTGAAEALGKSKSPEAAAVLTKAVQSSQNPGASEALTYAGQPGAVSVDALLSLLNDPQKRDRAIEALANTKDPRAVEPLIALLQTPYSGKPQPYGNGIGQAANDPNPVRPMTYYSVAEALGRMGDPRAVAPLIEYLQNGPVQRMIASDALAELGPPAVGPLIGLLHDSNEQTRRLAAKALASLAFAQTEDHRAKDALVAALKAKDIAIVAGGYQYYVSLGAPGSQGMLAAALDQFGDQLMAEWFLNCGNVKLEDAARAWAEKRHTGIEQHVYGVVWGKMPTPDKDMPPMQ
jgi:HEAT repeat protein